MLQQGPQLKRQQQQQQLCWVFPAAQHQQGPDPCLSLCCLLLPLLLLQSSLLPMRHPLLPGWRLVLGPAALLPLPQQS